MAVRIRKTNTNQDDGSYELSNVWDKLLTDVRNWKPVNKVNVDLYSVSTQTLLTCSDMDHTVLPANNTISAFTPQSQSITAL